MRVEKAQIFPVMMSLQMASPLHLVFLFMISGALGNEWSVTYSKLNLCALKGSTVFMNVTYTHPTRLTVKNRFWLINSVQGKEPTDLRNDSGYSGRVEYSGDEQKHFSLRLSDVKKSDEQKYWFRITTNEEKERYQGHPGVTFTVTDLQVIAPAEVTEGQSAVLICNTTCSLTDPTFIWYKNRRDLTTNTPKSNELHLQPVSSEDAGSYSCAVRGYEHLPSPDQTLRVRYPPKNVSVSISSSGEIVEGSSVTLTCSSDANPPVKNYTWFKGTTSVGKEKTYTISKISSEDSGEYKCKCSNEVGHQDSISVTLNVLWFQSLGVYAGVGAVVFVCVCLIITFLFIRSRRQKKKADEGDSQNVGPSAKDDTYAALDLAGWTSDDVYHTLAISHPSPPADTPTSSD
ncbi:B-cell receptor CD22 isoform X1 [Ictalurus furcatus]|uniref:B-cell receptor CD22 isoform X1 n=2 Tax=Ictalurus furcatus TaxID=66913 RepID=UPI0023506D8E|nr:B-cell receptor CD22 isoform X1 [Ictalurus furcatus]XP_053470937.1 B-cell receptor CD22 isoform X1 [Ictalurus furcatus]XP_053470938.1 B-cell receptor CD22 isoform X1 [Ictalurus furcatus]